MKSLALSVVLLFFIGTQGHSIARREAKAAETPETPGAKESLKNIFKDCATLYVELSTMLESPWADIKNHIDNKMESVVYNGYNVLWKTYAFVKEAFDEEEKEIQQLFPTFKTEVEPIIQSANEKYIKYLFSLKDDILPVLKVFYEEMEKQDLILWNKLLSLLKRDEDKLMAMKEELIANLKPFMEDIKQELAAAEKARPAKQSYGEEIKHYKEVVKTIFSYTYKDTEKALEWLEEYSKKDSKKEENNKEV